MDHAHEPDEVAMRNNAERAGVGGDEGLTLEDEPQPVVALALYGHPCPAFDQRFSDMRGRQFQVWPGEAGEERGGRQPVGARADRLQDLDDPR